MRSDARTRVLVTGASGKIGTHVVNELITRGYCVRALTSKSANVYGNSNELEWRVLDFQESLEFDDLVRGCSVVIHLGAELNSMDRMPRSNVDATRALAEASERAHVKFFCYTSSVSVYGSARRRRVTEDSPVMTTDRDVRSEFWGDKQFRTYGRTKLQGEKAINAVAHNVEYVTLRPTLVVDTRDLISLQDWHKPKKQWYASRHAHHIYVFDVANAILWFMERSLRRDRPAPGVDTFNLSEDDTPVSTYGQIFKAAYAASHDPRWRVAAIPWPVEWLLAILRARRVILRHPFGRMTFADTKLRQSGYMVRFGMSQAVSNFCAGLTPLRTTDHKGQATTRASHDVSVESAYEGGQNVGEVTGA